MGPKQEHRETVNAVEDWLRQYGFIVLKGYSVPIMDTHTAVVMAFSEASRRERGEKYKRIVPIVKPDLLAHSPKLHTTIAVEVAITSNPVEEAEKLELLNMEHEVARPLMVTSSHRDGSVIFLLSLALTLMIC